MCATSMFSSAVDPERWLYNPRGFALAMGPLSSAVLCETYFRVPFNPSGNFNTGRFSHLPSSYSCLWIMRRLQ